MKQEQQATFNRNSSFQNISLTDQKCYSFEFLQDAYSLLQSDQSIDIFIEISNLFQNLKN
jgi:hypothetical protein